MSLLVVWDTWTILSIIQIVFCILIIPIISLYSLKLFFKNNDEPYFTKRRPKLVKLFIYFGLSYIILDRSFILLIKVILNINEYAYIDDILAILTIVPACLLFLLRLFILWFDHNFHLGSTNDAWRRHVGSVASQNWFEKNQKKFGSKYYLFIYTITIWIILVALFTFVCLIYIIHCILHIYMYTCVHTLHTILHSY